MIFGNKKRILIEFFDSETGEKLGFDEKKPKHIPLSFEHDTEIEFGGKRWKLMSAEPFERKHYLKAGTIRIGVAEIMEEGAVDLNNLPEVPAETLYRAASRAAFFPDFSESRQDKDVLEMARWEWRQVEFLPEHMRASIMAEFALIETIKSGEATEQAGRTMYRKQHVRSISATALATHSWTPSVLQDSKFDPSEPLDGLTFMGEEGLAEETFAMRLSSGIMLYGLADNGKVRSLGLKKVAVTDLGEGQANLARLHHFMDEAGLAIVDWENLNFVPADLLKLSAFLDISLDTGDNSEEAKAEAESTRLAEAEDEVPAAIVAAEPALEAATELTPAPQEEAETASNLASDEEEESFSVASDFTVGAVPSVLPDDAQDDMSFSVDLDHEIEQDSLLADPKEEE